MDERRVDEEASISAPGGFVYWGLIIMGFGVFAPAILLPEWRAYEALLEREHAERQRLGRLEHAVEQEQRMASGLRSDPAVVGRVAQRELGFRRLDDQWIPLTSSTSTESLMLQARTRAATFPFASAWETEDLATDGENMTESPVTEAQVPVIVAPLVAMLPPLPYDFLFCDPRTRLIMMCLGMSAIVAAVLLFGRRPAADTQEG